eukprot:scaffold165837_cov51-Attheya_sp.AAC.2
MMTNGTYYFYRIIPIALLFVKVAAFLQPVRSRHCPWVKVHSVDKTIDFDDDQDGTRTDDVMFIHHFNNAGASPSTDSTRRVVSNHVALEEELGGYAAEEAGTMQLDQVYRLIGRLLNADSSQNMRSEVALVESATVGWTRIFYSAVETIAAAANCQEEQKQRERVILMSQAEYAANIVAACHFVRAQNARSHQPIVWRILTIPSSTFKGGISTGMVNVTALESMLSGQYKYHDTSMLNRDESNIDDRESMVSLNPDDIALVCVTHIPTNSGIVNPVYTIGQLLDKYNQKEKSSSNGLPSILYLVDACQSAGQTQLDVSAMKCHALTATGRKYLRAPRGTGFVFVKRDIANDLVPSHIDHSSAPILAVPSMFDGRSSIENIIDFRYKDGARRFEFWESNIANKLGLGEAIRVALEDIGINQIEMKCTNLGNYLRAQLREMPHVTLHHDIPIVIDTTATIENIWQAEHRTSESHMCCIVTFSVDGMEPIAVKKKMESAREKRKQLVSTIAAEEDGESLENHSFQLSVVPATSTPLDSAEMMVGDLLRASLSYFNTYAEIDLLCSKLASALKSQ